MHQGFEDLPWRSTGYPSGRYRSTSSTSSLQPLPLKERGHVALRKGVCCVNADEQSNSAQASVSTSRDPWHSMELWAEHMGGTQPGQHVCQEAAGEDIWLRPR